MSVEEAQEFVLKCGAFFKKIYEAHGTTKRYAYDVLQELSAEAYNTFYCDVLRIGNTLEEQQARIEDLEDTLKAKEPQNLYDLQKFEIVQELMKACSLQDLETFLKCKTDEI